MGEEENSAIVLINQAQVMLEKASDIQEVLDIHDRAKGFWAIANAKGAKELAQQAKVLEIKAERKAGDWLAEHVDHRGAAAGNDLQDESRLPDGIDSNESHRWQIQASVPEDEFNAWIDDCMTTNKEITAVGLRRLARAMAVGSSAEDDNMGGGYYRLQLNMIKSAIREHDRRYLIDEATVEVFDILELPYQQVRDWVNSGCKSIEMMLCDLLDMRFHEPNSERMYEPAAIEAI